MIFEADLRRARARQAEMASALTRLREARERLVRIRTEYEQYVTTIERELAVARHRGDAKIPIAAEPGAWEWSIEVDAHRTLDAIRANWARAIRRVVHTLEKLDRRIKKLEDRKFLVDYWIVEKEENWGKIDLAKLREQMREIILAGDELSQFILGRKVDLAFDTAQGAPLGYVPVHKTYKTDRKVYLSTILLEHQPPHLMDYYRALIVHELGHVLLHLRDSDYRRLCRLMRKHITTAPGFFDIFNILLDQQLERTLRDTRPEWQTWFNRLDFYTRKIPLRELREVLSRAGHADPDAAIADLASRRLIKVYDDPVKPFAAIQSGELFSQGLPFSRLYAFYAVFANKLPLASLKEPWLREAVEQIPKDFKTLSIFEVHALAVEVYRILFGPDALSGVWVEFERSKDGTCVPLLIPGSWSSAQARVRAVRETKRKKEYLTGRLEQDEPPPPPLLAPPSNPEGEPPPPPPPPPREPPPPRGVPQPLTHVRTRRRTGARPSTTAPRLLRQSKRKPKQSWKVPKVGLIHSKLKGSSSPKPKKNRSKRKPPKAQTSPPNPPKIPVKRPPAPRASTQPPRPRPAPTPPPTPGQPPRVTSASDFADQLAQERLPTWSPEDSMTGVTAALDRLLAEVRAEMAEKRAAPLSQGRQLPEGGKPSDQRNETDVRDFPPIQKVLTLPRDLVKNEQLLRQARPLVAVLRPYLSVLELDKLPQERLMVGRRLLSSGLTRHLAYGETRLFADLRLTETDLHRDVLISVLIDTSASMQTDDRLGRAQRLAILLAECLRDCAQVEATFVAYNQNVTTCGGPDEHTLASLVPNGKTNEAGALAYLRDQHLHSPRRRKMVLVLTDGLPTDCSVESVRFLVRSLEKDLGVRFLYGSLSSAEHPAYSRRVDLTGPLTPGLVRALGKALTHLLV